MDCMNKVTSIEELRAAASGTIVELPPFAEGHPFYARLRRPSMLALVKGGKIPNELLTSANTLFVKGAGSMNTLDEDLLNRLFGVMDVLCEAAFVEPTYAQIKEAGIQLTDEQITFIFGYSQNGVRELNSFRK